MRFLHITNALLWTINGLLWALYVQSPWLAGACAIAAIGSAIAAERAE